MAPCVTSGSPHPTTSEKSSWSLLQARFYLLSLVPHDGAPRFSPSLVLPTSLKGAGIESFKVTNRGRYFLRFSGTAGCAVSSLLVCSFLLPLSANRHSLLQHHVEGSAVPAWARLTSQLRFPTLAAGLARASAHPHSDIMSAHYSSMPSRVWFSSLG